MRTAGNMLHVVNPNIGPLKTKDSMEGGGSGMPEW